MSEFLQFLLSGIGVGAIYALVAVGFSIVYKGTRAINFAQGEYVVVGGILASVLTRSEGWPLGLAVVAVVVGGAMLGIATELVAVRLLKRPDALTMTIGTVAIGIAIAAVVGLESEGTPSYALDAFSGDRPIEFAGALVSPQTLWNIAIVIVAAVAMAAFFNRTRRGISLRAAADDPDSAGACGVSVGTTTLWTFGLAGALGALAGAAITPVTLMAPAAGVQLGLVGFAAAMLGGLGSLQGALVGGLVLGIAETLVAGYVSSTYASLVAFVVLLGVLFTRPTGLFREVEVQRV